VDPRRARSPSRATALAAVLAVAAATPAPAWHTEGHRRVAEDAVGLLPQSVPHFFRAGAARVGHAAVGPDVWKIDAVPALADGEGPEHYLDVELLGGRAWPELRSAALGLYAELGLEARRAGLLPWAVIEGAERLATCFAEHRRWPRDPAIRSECLVYAGWLAHYGGDLAQPLHTTIHHDGRALANGESPRAGVHRRIDALFETVPFERRAALAGAKVAPVSDLWAHLRAEFGASHRLVDRTYALLPALDGARGVADPRVVEFTAERYRATARFLAELFLWAWERSGAIELPSWLTR